MGLLGELASLFRDPGFRSLAGQARCERDLNSFLAASVGGRGNAVVAGVEVDVLRGSAGVEVKLDPQRFYEGFEQALAMRLVAGLGEVGVLQVYRDGVSSSVLERVGAMSRGTGVPAVVVDLSGGGVYELG